MRFRLLIVVAVTLCVFGGYAIGIALGTTVPGLLSGLALSALAAAAAAWAVAQAQPGAPRLVAEALAERYADNFLFVIMETLADSPPDSIAGPYRVLVLIPESTEAQERLASEVAQVSTTIEIPSPTGGRSYGVYAYPDPRGTRVVDVPSTLRGLGTAVVPGGPARAPRALYTRFADHLQMLVEQRGPTGTSVQIVRNARQFPLS
jgi:hypothetical protein